MTTNLKKTVPMPISFKFNMADFGFRPPNVGLLHAKYAVYTFVDCALGGIITKQEV